MFKMKNTKWKRKKIVERKQRKNGKSQKKEINYELF